MNIQTSNLNLKYNVKDRTFSMSGKEAPFSTEHTIENAKSGQSKLFKLSHSTGSEWDPKTEWIYKTDCGLTLKISNDEVTDKNKRDYLSAKLRN